MSQRSIETSMERLSTGKRINSAADDAAGVAISSRLNANLKGINQSIRNALDAQALFDTAEGAMQETERLLQRIRELAVQAANDTNSANDRAALDAEKTQLLAEIDRIASNTTWAGQNLLDGTFTNKSFNVGGGTTAMDSLSSSIASITSQNLVNLSETDEIIIAWENWNASDSNDIYFQRLKPDGSRINNAVLASPEISTKKTNPSILALSNGNTIVAWGGGNVDNPVTPINAQMFDGQGRKIGNQFSIGSAQHYNQKSPVLEQLTNGSIVAVWRENGTDGHSDGVFGQLMTENGTLIGSAFQVNSYSNKDQSLPSISALNDGGFIVAWESEDDNNAAGGYGIYAQKFDVNGARVGSEIQVSSNTNKFEMQPKITTLSNGNVVVTWQVSNDGSNHDIYARIFNSNGTPQNLEFIVNTLTANNEREPSITFLKGGGFVVSWEGSNHSDIRAQIFDNNGNRIGAEKVLTDNYLDYASELIALNDGGFFLAYEVPTNDGDIMGMTFDSIGNEVSSKQVIHADLTGSQDNPTLTLRSAANFSSAETAGNVISIIDTALQTLNSQRASLGALSNRIDHIVANNTNISINIAKSISRIEDADFAAETTNLAKQQILQQAAVAMLAQANASKQNILTLLQI